MLIIVYCYGWLLYGIKLNFIVHVRKMSMIATMIFKPQDCARTGNQILIGTIISGHLNDSKIIHANLVFNTNY